jgi:two-component system, NtrC family, sensor kinase
MKALAIFLFLIPIVGFAQQPNVFKIDSLPKQGILLDKGWKWHAGDNPDFAKPDFDDSGWESIEPTKNIIDLPQIPLNGQVFWLRCTFSIDSGSFQPMVMQLEQCGATKIFLNSKQIHSFGSFTKGHIKALTPAYVPLSCPIHKGGQYILAVRYVCQPNIHYAIHFANTCALFKLQFFTPEGWHKAYRWKQYDRSLNIVVSSFFICLCLLFFVFYSFFLKKLSNLYFALYALMYGLPYLFYGFFFDTSSIAPLYWYYTLNIVFGVIGYISIQAALHSQFEQQKGVVYWLFVILGLISIPISLNYYRGWEFYGIIVNFLGSFAIMWLGIRGIKQQKRGASIIAAGGGFFFVFWIGFLLFNSFSSQTKDFAPFFYALAQISIPIATAIFVGYDFAQTNISLQQQLEQNQKLSIEKQQILATQNETLERQVAERTAELKASQTQLIQKEKLASLGELTAGIAHEIQNPLNFVNNFSELSVELLQELSDEIKAPIGGLGAELLADISQNLAKINLHGKRASSIVKGMLEHSRSSTGIKELTDINKLADEYLRLSYHGLRAKDSSFNCDYELIADNNLPKIEVVPQEIGRVLLNLLNNAFYAVNERTKQGEANYQPKVTVTTKVADNQLQIRVTDNGLGIPDAIKDKIFQPFFTTKPTGEGTGLGLSLAYDIVTKGHSGAMEVESVMGEGTTFVVKLPT